MKLPAKRDHLLVAKRIESTNDRRLRELLNRIQMQAPYRVPKNSSFRAFVSERDLAFIRRRLGIATYGRYVASRAEEICRAR